jgi:hypothetical protein
MSIKLPLPNTQTGSQTPTPYIAQSCSLARLQHPARQPLSSLAAATAGSALHTVSLPDRDRWLGIGGCGAHALLDLAGHGEESLLDVGRALRGGLEEGDAEAVCEFLEWC